MRPHAGAYFGIKGSGDVMTAIYDTDDNGDITVCGGTEMVVIEGQSDREAPYGKHRCPYCERDRSCSLH